MTYYAHELKRHRFSRLNEINTDALNPKASYGFIPGLDGLRALSVIIVLIAHFGLKHIVPGGFGVTVFFFISGFLITRLLIAEQESKGQINLLQFYTRRLIRLYPALLFMLITTTIVSGLLGQGVPGTTEMLAGIFYFMNFYHVHAVNIGHVPVMSWTPLWSLAVEEHFYVLFPLLVLMTGLAWKRLHHAIIAILIAVPLWRLFQYFNYSGPVDEYNYMITFARIDSIAWGCLLTVSLHKSGIESLKRLVGILPMVFAVFVLLATFLVRDDMFRWVLRFSIQGAAIYVLVLNLYYLASLRWVFKILDFKPLVWIGMTSYALYLWHLPIYDFIHYSQDASVFSIALTIGISLFATAFSFYIVEKPFMKLRKKFGSHMPKRIETPSA